MRLNWCAYQFRFCDGYGRYSGFMIRALQRAGHEITPILVEYLWSPAWLQRMWDVDYRALTISCMPPYFLQKMQGPQWALSMTEGSELPDGWGECINNAGVERVIVPCDYNAEGFRNGGIKAPVVVIPGGTDPEEFPILPQCLKAKPDRTRPYTFLALGDRGSRKGWIEVWQAFYATFGTPTDTPDVRLVIKARPEMNDLLQRIAGASNLDPRVSIQIEDARNVADVYTQADCFVIPSRSEGWGMPHREAAMMGLPVITLRYSGMDDGHTDQWAIVVDEHTIDRIPTSHESIQGLWAKADVAALARTMRDCYDDPAWAQARGLAAAQWLRRHQTWDHVAARLIAEIGAAGYDTRPTAPIQIAAPPVFAMPHSNGNGHVEVKEIAIGAHG